MHRSSFSRWVNHRDTFTGSMDRDRALLIVKKGETVARNRAIVLRRHGHECREEHENSLLVLVLAAVNLERRDIKLPIRGKFAIQAMLFTKFLHLSH